MLKEEEIAKKKLSSVKMLTKRTIDDSDRSTPEKIRKICEYDNDENTNFELPSVCIFIMEINF